MLHSWFLVRFVIVGGIFVTVIVVLTPAGIIISVGEMVAMILNVVHLDMVLYFSFANGPERR